MKLNNMDLSSFWFCSILAVVAAKSLAVDKVIEGTELELAFMVHRHGDRTPVEDIGNLDTAESRVHKKKLRTTEGKQRGYRTGAFIRQRYNEQLSWRYNRSEIYIRSTDSTRAKMTVLTALSAIYPAVGKTWSPFIDWVPVPYTTIEPKYDEILYIVNCPTYMTAFAQLLRGPAPSILEKHADLLDKITEMTGINFTSYPAVTYGLYDGYISIEHLGYELAPEILDIMPELQDAAGEAVKLLHGSEEYLSLISGPLLNEFFAEATKVISGESTQKLRIYSAHDANVYGFEAITGVINLQGVPKYGSLYSLELRRVVETGEYVVLVKNMNHFRNAVLVNFR